MKVLDRKVRGFRLVDLCAAAVLIALILGVYLAKTMAGRERAEIASIDRQIAEEKDRTRLLEAEVAHLEEPARLERLSQAFLGLAPVNIRHDVSADGLADVARSLQATPPVQSAGAPQAQLVAFDPTRGTAAPEAVAR